MSDKRKKLVFYSELCDGVSQCWFLKDGNCKVKVFEYDASKEITSRLTPHLDRCVGCAACEGHCPAARLAYDDERDTCMEALKELKVKLGDRDSDGLFAQPIINEELNIYTFEGDIAQSVQNTLTKLNKIPSKLQIIELFNTPVCFYGAVVYSSFRDTIVDILSEEIFDCGFERKIIYTDSIEAVKQFLVAFNIDEQFINSVPLLIIYQNHKVLAVWGHGKITKHNFQEYVSSLKEDILGQLRKRNQ